MPKNESELNHERWRYEQNRQIAERFHDNNNNFMEQSNRAAIENGNITLRTLILINGGAAIAVLAFIGGIVSADAKNFLDDIEPVTAPIKWFAWGVALATLAMGLAYVTNYCITSAIDFRKASYQEPYIRVTDQSKRWTRWALRSQIGAVLLAVASLGCFLVGMYSVREAAALLQ